MQKRLFCCLCGQGHSQDCFAVFVVKVTVKIVLPSLWSRSQSRFHCRLHSQGHSQDCFAVFTVIVKGVTVSGNSSHPASLSSGGAEERDYPALSAVAVVVSVTGSLR